MEIPYTLLSSPSLALGAGLVSGGFFCCILTPHSCNLKAVQNLLKKYEKESSEK